MSTTTEQPEYRVVTRRTGPELSPCWVADVQCRQAPARVWFVLKGIGLHRSPRDAEAAAERWLADYRVLGWSEATRLMEARALLFDDRATVGETREILLRLRSFVDAIEDPQVLMYLRDLIRERLDGVKPGGEWMKASIEPWSGRTQPVERNRACDAMAPSSSAGSSTSGTTGPETIPTCSAPSGDAVTGTSGGASTCAPRSPSADGGRPIPPAGHES